jgi:hypothetical protein
MDHGDARRRLCAAFQNSKHPRSLRTHPPISTQ